MSVFERFFRRSKATEEASTSEVQADTQTAEAAVEETAETKKTAETKESDEVKAEETAQPAAVEATGTSTDNVEIPKQQSAGEAADNEAGESART